MSTRPKIAEALNENSLGDVEKYFEELANVIEKNSGINDFKIVTTDCHSTSAPVKENNYTRFELTDASMDIVDLSKGYINLKVTVDLVLKGKDGFATDLATFRSATTRNSNTCFFVGFKSAAHVINCYNIYSNNRITNAKQTKAKYEQAINYICKSEQERKARPGMYSPIENVMQMSECVAGSYVWLEDFNETTNKTTITLDLVIQVDDLLPLSAMSYFPRFMFGDITLELSANVIQNMIFVQIPPSVARDVYRNKIGAALPGTSKLYYNENDIIDLCYTQCGDYAKGRVLAATQASGEEYATLANEHADSLYTIEVSNLNITEGKSFINGFNIKQESKQSLLTKFSDKPLMIPGQWVEHYNFSQMPTRSNMRCNIIIPLWNASQIIATFPNSSNQLTVSYNPHLESVQMHVNDRILPDKFVTTLDHAHSEMILNALGLDSLFSASPELINSLVYEIPNMRNNLSCIAKECSDYMFVANLERFGSGCFCDGMNAMNCPITLSANYLNGTQNQHYYDLEGNLRAQNVNLFVVSDCFWVCSTNGIDLVKDQM